MSDESDKSKWLVSTALFTALLGATRHNAAIEGQEYQGVAAQYEAQCTDAPNAKASPPEMAAVTDSCLNLRESLEKKRFASNKASEQNRQAEGNMGDLAEALARNEERQRKKNVPQPATTASGPPEPRTSMKPDKPRHEVGGEVFSSSRDRKSELFRALQKKQELQREGIEARQMSQHPLKDHQSSVHQERQHAKQTRDKLKQFGANDADNKGPIRRSSRSAKIKKSI